MSQSKKRPSSHSLKNAIRIEALETRLLLSTQVAQESPGLEAQTSALTVSGDAGTQTAAAALASTPWPYGEWAYRKLITVDHTKVSADQANFPLLVTFTDVNLAARARTDAADIFFTADDGQTRLDYEIESYNASTGKLTAWVRVPLLSASADTSVFMYYANPSATDSQNPAAVWGSGYVAVHHLEEGSGTVTDSSPNDRDGTALNGVTYRSSGMIDGGFSFDGVNDRVTLPQLYSGTSAFTIEGWVRPNSKQGYIFNQRDTTGVMLQYYPGQFELYVNGTKLVATAAAGQWYHVAATFSGSTARLYLNGVQVASSSTASVNWPAMSAMLGDRPWLGRAYSGRLDEMRFSSVARSASYLAAAYSNAQAPAEFYSVEDQDGHAPSITSLNPADGATGVIPILDALQFELSDPNGQLMDYTVTTSSGIGTGSGVAVGNGVYQVPLTGLQANTTYTWTIQVTNGESTVTRTASFTTGRDWGMPSWRYRLPITIDHDLVPATQTDFPVLVEFTSAELAAHAQGSGVDLVFTDSDTVTQLDYEIESYDAATGHVVAWVRVDSLSATTDRTIYLYYGNSSAELEPQDNPVGVWGSSYRAVHHMEETAGNLVDSTGNYKDGVPANGVVLGAQGRLGSSIALDGLDDIVELPQMYSGSSAFSVEAWVYSGDQQGYVFTQRDVPGNGASLQYYAPSRQFQLLVGTTKLSATATMNQWHHVVATFSSGTARLYLDGEQVASGAATLAWPDLPMYAGDHPNFDRTLLGQIDELRFLGVAVSASYVAASYASQSDPGTFAVVGAQQKTYSSIFFTDAYPAPSSADVELNPTLAVTLDELDHAAMDYTVEIFRNGSWQLLASGSGVQGPTRISVPTTGLGSYLTQYSWRVTARTAEQTKVQTFTFTTRRSSNYAPFVLDAWPGDYSTAIPLTPTLQVTLKDLDNNPMNATFSILDPASGTWKTLRANSGVGNGVYTADATAYVNRPMYDYQWRIVVSDPGGSGQSVTKLMHFRTGGAITPKWQVQLDMEGGVEGQLMPVMGDIDNDGQQEVVVCAGSSLYAINGITGQIEWQIDGESREVSAELVDLNNDGVPEILYALSGARIRAVRGDGTILWTSRKLQGSDMSLFPILAYDIDGDGYPTIYVTTADTLPEFYSGNIEDYTGALNMLDHNGNLLAHTWLYKPCWGGASLADVNNDGRFELFVSDRRYGFNDVPSHGLASYDAATLTMIWSRPDVHHSSPIPIIADVNGDGKLDIVAQRIVGLGPMILDAATGKTIKDYSNLSLPTHGTATLADIDLDGHMELLMATGYYDTLPKDFAVFDLVTGKTEFRPTFPYHASWAPTVGDVTGDGVMEILAGMGDQGGLLNYPLMVYDNRYKLIDRIDASGAGQLASPRVFDTDGDGLNEIVVGGRAGKLLAYDTFGLVPDPAPRTWTQMYSEYRTNNPVYTPSPGPAAPVLSELKPANDATTVGLQPMLSVKLFDWQHEAVDLTFEVATLENGVWQWQTAGTVEDQRNGTVTCPTMGIVMQANTLYKWRVTARDMLGNTTQQSGQFTTMTPDPWAYDRWKFRNRLMLDSTQVGGAMDGYTVLVDIVSPALAQHAQGDGDDILFALSDGTRLSHEVESYDGATGHLVAWVALPSVATDHDTAFYLYYSNPDAGPQGEPASTWPGYRAVHHLEETSGLVTDSGAEGLNGTVLNGAVQGSPGRIGSAYTFDGVDDRIALPQVFTTQTAFTIEGWIKPGDKQGYVFYQRDSYGRGVMLQYYGPSDEFQLSVGSTKVAVPASADQWHYVIATFDGTDASLSVDGGAPVTAAATLVWPNAQAVIGDQPAGGRAFLGQMDELRLSSMARGEAYRCTVWNNVSSPGTFLSLETQEQRPHAPLIDSLQPAGGAIEVSPDITELTFSLEDDHGDPMDVTVVSSPDIGGLTLTGVGNGTYSVPVSGLQKESTYSWTVTATDGTFVRTRTFSFITEQIQEPQILTTSIVDGADKVSMQTTELTFTVRDSQGDPLSVTASTSPDAGSLALTAVGNGTYALPLTGLEPQTAYVWAITVSDGVHTTQKTIGFTTDQYQAPQITIDSPSDGALEVAPDLAELVFTVADPQNDPVDLTVVTSPNIGGLSLVGAGNDTYHVPLENLQSETTYTWTVTASDGSHTSQRTFTFTTGQLQQPQIRNVSPADQDGRVPANLTQLSFELFDRQGDPMDVTVVADGGIGGLTLTQVGNGSYVVPVSGLVHERTYTWTITVSDGVNTTQQTLTFTVDQIQPPQILSCGPSDGAVDVSVELAALTLELFDRQGDLMDVTVTASGNIGGLSLSDVGNGVYTVPLANLLPLTTYTWTVSVSDGVNVTERTFTFRTGQLQRPWIDSPFPSQTMVPLDQAELTFVLTDPQNDLLDVTVTTSPNIGGLNLTDADGGVFHVALANLQAGTTYAWTVTAVDSDDNTTQKTYSFTTMSTWADAQWRFRRQITLDRTKVGGTLSQYTMLLDVTLADLAAHAQADGDDIFFALGDGTRLSHEIEQYNASTGRLVAWVKVPNVSASQDTVLYMYYGNAASGSQQSPASTWTGYKAVHHLEESTGAVTDSTANGVNGTALNGVLRPAAGLFGSGYSFDGVNDRISLPQVFTARTPFTIEVWVRPGNKQGYIFSQRNASSQGVLLQYYAASGQFEFYVNSTKLTVKAAVNQWHYVTAGYDGTRAWLSIDGGTPVTATASFTVPAVAAMIGDQASGGRAFLGQMDELRISLTSQTTAARRTVWNNLSSPGTFASLGSQELWPHAPTISDPGPTDGQGEVPLDHPQLIFQVQDRESQALDITVTTTGGVGELSLTGVGGGTYAVVLTNLQNETTYYWTVTVSDGVYTSQKTYAFTTGQVQAPQILAATPASGDLGVPLDLAELTFELFDQQGDLMEVTVTASDDIGSLSLTGVGDGVYRVPISGLQAETAYTWTVTASDGTHAMQKTMTFFTGQFQPPQITPGGPADGATDVPLDLAELTFELMDAQGDPMNVTVTTSPDAGSLTLTGVGNGLYHVPLANLRSETAYTWTITASDAARTTQRICTFTTGQVQAPQIVMPWPAEQDLAVSPDLAELTFELSDRQGDAMDVTAIVSPDAGSLSLTGVGNGTYAVGLADLLDNTTYTLTVTATDQAGNVSQQIRRFHVAEAWGLQEWNYRQTVTVDHARVGSTVDDYAMLVDVTSPQLGQFAQADGDDIVFALPDGTRLSHEIESYDGATGHLVAWVLLGQLSAQSDTVLHLHYGNATCDSQQSPAALWTGYRAVHHFEEPSGVLSDSSGNALDGTVLNGVTQGTTGWLGGAYSFDGVDDAISLPTVFTTETAFTIEGWIKPESQQGYIFIQRDSLKRGVLLQYYAASGNFEFYVDQTRIVAPAAPGQWHYVVASFDGTTASLSVDGGPAATAAATLTWPSAPAMIGNQPSGGRAFLGQIDELRISGSAVSETYRQTAWSNLSNPAAFVALGDVQQRPVVPVIAVQGPADGATDVSLSLSELTVDLQNVSGAGWNLTVTSGPDVGGLSLSDVGTGLYFVPLGNLQPLTTYTWTVQLVGSGQALTKTLSFTTAA